MKALFRSHPVLMVVLSVSLLLSVFFAARLVVGAVYWSQHREEPVSAWMTVGYVGKSWHLDPREIDRVAGLPLPEGHPLTLEDIARQRGVPVAEIIAQVEAAIARLKADEAARSIGPDGGQP